MCSDILTGTLNALNRGRTDGQTRVRRQCEIGPLTSAVSSVHDTVLREACRLELGRRGLPSGGHALARILKVPNYDAYHAHTKDTTC